MRKVILIYGDPESGKSSIAQALAAQNGLTVQFKIFAENGIVLPETLPEAIIIDDCPGLTADECRTLEELEAVSHLLAIMYEESIVIGGRVFPAPPLILVFTRLITLPELARISNTYKADVYACSHAKASASILQEDKVTRFDTYSTIFISYTPDESMSL